MSLRTAILAVVVLLLASVGCASPDRPAGDTLLDWTIVEARDLRDPTDAMSPRPWGIAADTELRRVYVADGPNQRVLVFDSNGNLLDELGRAGEGPGEYVFESDGRYIGTLTDVPVPIAFVAPDEFVAFRPDDEYGVALQVLRVAPD